MQRTESDPPAIPENLVGVFRVLAEQHRESAALIQQIQTSPGRRGALWPTLRQALVSHEHAEVRELFPVLRQVGETRGLADHHDDEARDLDAMIGRIDRTPPASEAWGALFDQLVQTIKAHVAEEETTIFPAAQAALGERAAQQLELTVLDAKQKLAQLA